MYNIAIIRPFGNNVGNWAINFAIRNMLHERFGRLVSVLDYPATAKYESGGSAGLTSSTVYELNRIADGVIVGGGNLFENGEIDVSPTAITALEPPLLLFSNSWGRIYNNRGVLVPRSDAISASMLGCLCEKASLVSSRDSATADYLGSLGLPRNKGLCPTVNVGRYRDLLPPLPDNERVGALISIRAPRLMNVPPAIQSAVFDQVLACRDALKERGHERVRLLCNDSRDVEFASIFRKSHGIDTIYASDIYQYLRLLADSEMIISYRLHATIPALSLGSKVASLVYDERALSLFTDLGLKEDEHFLNIVKDKKDFEVSIKNLVDTCHAADNTVFQKSWSRVFKDQMELFADFKNQIDSYISPAT